MDAPNENDERLERRSFLNYLITGAFALVATIGAYTVGRYLWPPKHETGGGAGGRVEVAAESEMPEGVGIKTLFGNKPVWVIHAPFGFVALSAVCTHLGCIVEYEKARGIWCPCHAAVFDLRGNVISGPAPKPLPSYPVAVVGGKVVIG